MTLQEEITRRRTFAVIAHPDAGKTTLTEKLLLFGGAIHVAGAVKSNKIKKGATSDFMEIERQRGISVATAVMGFEYKGTKINILDTPGHEDFAEDTYRTLTAVDSVIIVIDGAKGVESQTRKLMEVCRMRSTPVIVFINKLDRPSKEPFDLLDEVEKELRIRVRPLAFPISNGPTFKGVYNLYEKNLSLFTSDEKLTADAQTAEISDLASPELDSYIGGKFAEQLRSDVELVEGVYDEFDREAYLRGELAPVFFGSAVNNFGVRELLECFVRIAPSPRPAPTATRTVEPAEPKMTGFVFKIHANMDPNHRDRIAFLKICSGMFERNHNYLHVRSGKQLKFSSPTAFMAEKKSVIDFAYPGDIVGLHDTGNFKIGDTFTEGEKLKFTGIPSFAPEQFRYIENADPLKFKQLAKGVDQLMDEGVAQLFVSSLNGRKIIGTVGALQFEVIQYRLEHEYNAACRWEPISIYKACWIESDNAAQLADFKRRKHTNMAVDKHGRDVFLADTSYGLALAQENFKDIRFHFTSEFCPGGGGRPHPKNARRHPWGHPAGILSFSRQYARPGRVNRDAAGRSQVRTAQTGRRHGRRRQIAGTLAARTDGADRSQAWTPHARTSHGPPAGLLENGSFGTPGGYVPAHLGPPVIPFDPVEQQVTRPAHLEPGMVQHPVLPLIIGNEFRIVPRGDKPVAVAHDQFVVHAEHVAPRTIDIRPHQRPAAADDHMVILHEIARRDDQVIVSVPLVDVGALVLVAGDLTLPGPGFER